MRYNLTLVSVLLYAAVSAAAPAPYPVTVNSQVRTVPDLTVYRASEQSFAITFTDGATASDISGHTAWMSWATSNTASSVSTALCTIVAGTAGTARATFSSSALNYTPGRYVYEVGVTTGGTTRVYRQGVLIITGSPYAAGASPVFWTTNVNLGLATFSGWGNGAQWTNGVFHGNGAGLSNVPCTSSTGLAATQATHTAQITAAISTNETQTGNIAALMATNVNHVTTNDAGRVLDLTGATTVDVPYYPYGTNSAAASGWVSDQLEALSIKTLYGATNAHPVIAGAGSLWSSPPAVPWASTNLLADGTNYVGTYWNTNKYSEIRPGNYMGRFYTVKSGTKTVTAKIRLIWTADDGVTTNALDTSADSDVITTVLDSYGLATHAPTSIVTSTAILYLGVDYYLIQSGGGGNCTVVTYGGNPYDTHLETPGLGPAGSTVQQSTFNASMAAHSTTSAALTLAQAASSNAALHVNGDNAPTATMNGGEQAFTNYGSLFIGGSSSSIDGDLKTLWVREKQGNSHAAGLASPGNEHADWYMWNETTDTGWRWRRWTTSASNQLDLYYGTNGGTWTRLISFQTDSVVRAYVPLHMSGQRIIAAGDGTATSDVPTLAQLNANGAAHAITSAALRVDLGVVSNLFGSGVVQVGNVLGPTNGYCGPVLHNPYLMPMRLTNWNCGMIGGTGYVSLAVADSSAAVGSYTIVLTNAAFGTTGVQTTGLNVTNRQVVEAVFRGLSSLNATNVFRITGEWHP